MAEDGPGTATEAAAGTAAGVRPPRPANWNWGTMTRGERPTTKLVRIQMNKTWGPAEPLQRATVVGLVDSAREENKARAGLCPFDATRSKIENREEEEEKGEKREGGDVALIRPASAPRTPPPPTCVLSVRALQSDMNMGCVCAAAQLALVQCRAIHDDR